LALPLWLNGLVLGQTDEPFPQASKNSGSRQANTKNTRESRLVRGIVEGNKQADMVGLL